ncbi:hypothetical protein ACF1BP_23465 [Streptomyces sp. NPDC014735]|uniref:hypothetical protein n=1 Tax=Streptomyces sp. NPDC014735 TaxID=3364887 RepID=UPI0036FF0C4B
MTETRKKRLLPTGDCFCGCGGEAGIGRWFVFGHDITAAGALRAVEGGLSLPQRLVEAGFGPERSVVQEAVESAGWVRCERCAYAGTPAGLAAHLRGGGCDGAGEEPEGPGVPADGLADEGQDGTGQEGGGRTSPVAAAAGAGERAGGGRGESAGPVRVETGPARGLLLPGPDDGVWKSVPMHLRTHLQVAAQRLMSPEPPVLREKGNAPVRYALRAAAARRLAGRHWLVLLAEARESYGSARSERARKVFEVLEQVVADYLAPAVPELPATAEPPAAGEPAEEGADAAGRAAPEPVPAAGEAEPRAAAGAVPRVPAEAGAARGLLLPGPDDPAWEEVPLHLRQALRGAAHRLVTPVRGPLKAKEQRRVLSAVRAAERMRMTGAHWLLLMTTGREALGGPASARADAFYKVLEQILAEHPPQAQEDTPAVSGAAEAG